ncbi:hypothetical protein H1Z61_07425 [Bacillus aquiflavi]|uniref:DUF6792 domain-containing protein n=1 Tax=Bacillus aquiflavi TaxID=2672567 RepID=A0A6B3W1U7_9BACI|nr:DUF6792 domain-containing protein [Bacillus aquiflavi]MBA4536979.1 hypothetical protein [Bacillus aquiflavi]NEY82675.1 hypothetical protein [Bacillus aquiflavi]
MSNGEILNSDILRARIAELEYGKNGAITAETVRRIYIEETGKEPPGEITIYRSDDLEAIKKIKKDGKDSGFDGSIIHFYNPEKGINQSYTITRGTEGSEDNGSGDALDPMYDLLGIYNGKIRDQYDHAVLFDQEVTKQINEKVAKDIEKRIKSGENIQKVDLEKSGIGHSLGGNLIQMLQIMTQSYRNVYAINDAPPSVYQLALIDPVFAAKIGHKFKIDPADHRQLYELNARDLQAFGEQYYKERGQNIQHLTAEEDLMYAATVVRGFLHLGADRTANMIDTYPETKGVREILKNLSDDDLRSLQLFIADYAPAYVEGGVDGFIGELTGYDQNFKNSIDGVKKEWDKFLSKGPEWTSFNMKMPVGAPRMAFVNVPIPVPKLPDGLVNSLKDLATGVENIKNKLTTLLTQLPALIGLAEKVTAGLRKDIVASLKEVQSHAKSILVDIGDSGLVVLKNLFTVKAINASDIQRLITNAIKVKNEMNAIFDKLKGIFDSIVNFIKDFDKAVEAHGVLHVASSLAAENGRRYEGNDMILFKGEGAERIEINLSSAVRVYQTGLDKYQEKSEILNQLRVMYQQEYLDDFENRKRRLMGSIHEMESNPRSYSYLLPGKDREVTSINVHEDIRPLSPIIANTFEEMFHHFQQEHKKGIELIGKIKTSIENLFSEEKAISAIFDLR